MGSPPKEQIGKSDLRRRPGDEGDFRLLIVCTWRSSNELWDTGFHKKGGDMAEFGVFPRTARIPPRFA
jgi:hypothetical protein